VNSVSGGENLPTHYSDLGRISFYQGYLEAGAFPSPSSGAEEGYGHTERPMDAPW